LQVWGTLALKFGHINCQETFLTKVQGGPNQCHFCHNFVQTRVFLTDAHQKSFLKEKNTSAKETGTKAGPPDQRL
jgi:hypothetical protein